MSQVTIFTNNESQAVSVPKALEFPGEMKKISMTPVETFWDNWFEHDAVTADFMVEREQPADQERKIF
ncbi:MAG: type II toxin-antitoxin system VapB family antitoxin [Pseudomonadota bacterium]